MLQSGAIDGGIGCLFHPGRAARPGFLGSPPLFPAPIISLVTGPAVGEGDLSGLAWRFARPVRAIPAEALLEKLEADRWSRIPFYPGWRRGPGSAGTGKRAPPSLPGGGRKHAAGKGGHFDSTLEHELPGHYLFSGEALQGKEAQIRAFTGAAGRRCKALNEGDLAVNGPAGGKMGFSGSMARGLPFLPGPRALTRDEAAAAWPGWRPTDPPQRSRPAKASSGGRSVGVAAAGPCPGCCSMPCWRDPGCRAASPPVVWQNKASALMPWGSRELDDGLHIQRL